MSTKKIIFCIVLLLVAIGGSIFTFSTIEKSTSTSELSSEKIEVTEETVESEESEESKETIKTELGQERILADIQMIPVSFEKKQDDSVSEEGKILTVIQLKIENKTSNPFGIGAGDFLVTTSDGVKIETFGYHDSFGAVIEPGENLEGNMYFMVSENETEFILSYDPISRGIETKIEWFIGAPTH